MLKPEVFVGSCNSAQEKKFNNSSYQLVFRLKICTNMEIARRSSFHRKSLLLQDNHDLVAILYACAESQA
jgi:hypothetical protein